MGARRPCVTETHASRQAGRQAGRHLPACMPACKRGLLWQLFSCSRPSFIPQQQYAAGGSGAQGERMRAVVAAGAARKTS